MDIPMISPPPWYRKAEAWLEPSWPLLLAASAIIVGVTVMLVIRKKPIPLAAWLVYLYMP